MVDSFLTWQDPYLNHKTLSSLWSCFVTNMRDTGFDGQIVFSFMPGPIRKRNILTQSAKDFVLGENNGVIYVGDLPGGNDTYMHYATKRGLVPKDPLAFHARNNAPQAAIVGLDFLTPEMENYDDAKEYWSAPPEFKLRNALYLPIVHPNNSDMPYGFGLHGTQYGSDFVELVEKNLEKIMLDCFLFSSQFHPLYRQELVEEAGLTKRQHEVLKRICFGFSNKEIAQALKITEPTVTYHISVLRHALKCETNRELPLAAIRYGYCEIS